MGVQRNSLPSHVSDLEATAELPVLDVAAYEAQTAQDTLSGTDTWVAPVPPARDEAGLKQRYRLEEDLKSLSANLRAVEERLAIKAERLAALEGELNQVRAERERAEQRADSLVRDLAEAKNAAESARAQSAELARRLEVQESAARSAQAHDSALASNLADRERALSHAQRELDSMRRQTLDQLEILQSQEGRRGIFDHLLHALDLEVDRAQQEAAGLKRDLQAQSLKATELSGALSGGGQRIEVLEAELKALSSALSQRNEEAAASLRIGEELRDNVRTLTAANAAHRERIQALEGEVAAAAQAHANALLTSTNLQRDLEAAHAAQRERIAALEADLARARGEVEQGIAAAKEAESRHNERAATLEGDLRAAEDALNRMEGELRAKDSRVEELTSAGDEWRACIDTARQAVEERDALIRRLESEAAHSTALLDNIQHSIKFLEQPVAGPNEAEPEGAKRLRIRTEGEAEIVHVLGRKTSIGRTPDNDLQIEARFISRHHAVVLAGPNHTIIEDLNSTNGVLVNGRRVTRQTLKDGDQVVVGRTQFRFSVRPPTEHRAS